MQITIDLAHDLYARLMAAAESDGLENVVVAGIEHAVSEWEEYYGEETE